MKSTTVYSSVTTVAVVVAAVLATTTTTTTTSAFTMVAPILQQRSTSVVSLQAADTAKQAETATKKVPETQQLGLLTFDLDDTLYPIQKVAEEANGM
jgi:acyl-CoA hydrolase